MSYKLFIKSVFLVIVFCQVSSLLYGMDDSPMDLGNNPLDMMCVEAGEEDSVDVLARRVSGLVIVTEGLRASSGCPPAPRSGDGPGDSPRGDSRWTDKRRRLGPDDGDATAVLLWPAPECFMGEDVRTFSVGTFVKRKAKKGGRRKWLKGKSLKSKRK